MNYNSLLASNLSGEAVRATVQAPGRSIGSTAIPVNAITNWPTGTFIATTGTLLANGTLNPTTVQVFYGTATGTTVTITSFASGYSDVGNSVGDVVVIKPSTEWANVVGTHIKNITGNGTPEAVTAASLKSNGNPVWQYLNSAIVTGGYSGTATSYTLITGLTVTVTIPTGCTMAKVTASGLSCNSTAGAGNNYTLDIYDTTTSTEIGTSGLVSNTSSSAYSASTTVIGLAASPSAVSHTYEVRYIQSGAGTFTMNTGEAIILVECC